MHDSGALRETICGRWSDHAHSCAPDSPGRLFGARHRAVFGCPSGRYFDISARGCFRWAGSRQRVLFPALCSPLLCCLLLSSQSCSSLPAGIARVLLEASSGRGAGTRQLYACGLASARKTLAPRGESFVVALLREHTLLRTSRNELRPETVYILGSYAHARVTAGLLVILRRNAPSGVDRVARCAPRTTPPCQRRSDSGTPSPRQRRSDSRTPSPRRRQSNNDREAPHL